ncbi:citrate lyase subunit beta / citryl-CoA lyase [Pedococcus dokdonensis]|uniref:Citrate lyase subunit beta / citryl-CoA lyase n=1 Tax=Pedococcus dokdonensis TaxID=443156 RepID=A0A1H0TYA6_9MICO|nr:CoA ester lyase [Pedococcus dokdonensis]SDP58516.1 citrate lyase subunit beta / citryl-CoA lyase [Pedococcus dokdonensis]
MSTPADAPALTLLYAPADRLELVAKALAGAADVVIIDLEDAVAPDHKEVARAGLRRLLTDHPGRPVQVRVNALGSPWAVADLAAVAALPAHVGIRIPKVVDPAEVAAVAEQVGGRDLHPLVETAAGVEAAYDIARAHPRVATLALGEADLRSDLGVDSDDGMLFARSRIVTAARAAGLPPPAMSVHANVGDDEGLARSCALGRRLGFLGRAAIHPRQLPTIVTAFTPTEAEVDRARLVVESLRDASEVGGGTVVLADGTFLDRAMVEGARRVIALAERRRGGRGTAD